MDRYDDLMRQLATDVQRIGAAESEIASSSNRLLAELAATQRNNLSAAMTRSYRQNAERMLRTMITFTAEAAADRRPGASFHQLSSDSSTTTLLGVTATSRKPQPVEADSVLSFKSCVQQKCKQISEAEDLANVIIEKVVEEIGDFGFDEN